MKNSQMVNPGHVAQMIKKHENPIMSRLFCLVVWQEIKRIRSEGTPLHSFTRFMTTKNQLPNIDSWLTIL